MNGEDLKDLMENQNGVIECLKCNAIMWVDTDNRNDKGEPMLMRAGTVPIHECRQCDQIHRWATA